MALGTVVSRITGFFRMLLIAFTIGTLLDADLFNNANTIPNALYILVAGGIFNVVLVPQLVRTMKHDPDGGDAYAQRIITLGLLVLAVATVVLLLVVPGLVHVVFDQKLFTPGFEQQRESARLLMWLCMPQVFFYGAFVLVGQVLNARGRFGPMMWAPIANNLVAMAVLGVYLGVFGTSNGTDGFTTDQALLLGLGSTAGIAVQTARPHPVPAPGRVRVPPALRLPRRRPRAHAAARLLDAAVHPRQPGGVHRHPATRHPRHARGSRDRAWRPPAPRSTRSASWSARCRTASSPCRWRRPSSRPSPRWPPTGGTTACASSSAARCASRSPSSPHWRSPPRASAPPPPTPSPTAASAATPTSSASPSRRSPRPCWRSRCTT